MNPRQRVALVGFLFVAARAALGFGAALLCLIGAAVFYLATAVYRGELDFAELQQRSQPHTSRASRSANGSTTRLSGGQYPPGDGSDAQLRSAPPNPAVVGLQHLRSIK